MKKKKDFIHKEIWLLTTMGGFQRANLYDKDEPVNEKIRKKFREVLHVFIKEMALTKYTETVSEEEHIKNIKSISQFTADSNFSNLLNNEELNFGISQKLLNLYLKYLWCMELIETPTHFPVDRIIQEKLNKEVTELNKKDKNNKIPRRIITSWTKMTEESEYMEVIDFAKRVMNKTEHKTLAELELYLFERN